LRNFETRALCSLIFDAYGCSAAALKCFVVFLTFRNFLMNLCGAIFGDFELPESPARITLACLSAEPIALSDAFTSFA